MNDFINDNATFYFWLGVAMLIFGILCWWVGARMLNKALKTNEESRVAYTEANERLRECQDLTSFLQSFGSDDPGRKFPTGPNPFL